MAAFISSRITKEELLSQLDSRWHVLLKDIDHREYWNDIVSKINSTIENGGKVMPAIDRIFVALNKIDLSKFRVLLIGQDPYPRVGVATGYAFSTWEDEPIEKSLGRIYEEIDLEYGSNMARTHMRNGNLSAWRKQGVLLLNTVLTIGSNRDNHRKCGWTNFTNEVIDFLDANYMFVTLAFGGDAKETAKRIVRNKDLVITAGHPSPINTTVKFIGTNVFARCNDLLIRNSLLPINWILQK